jgi:hypothetical protein
MPWKAITALRGCKSVKPPKNYPPFFVFRNSVDDTGWLVGPYRALTRFATDLRNDPELRDFLSSNRIRIGLRKTDVPPANHLRQEKYGALIHGDNRARNFTAERLNPMAQTARSGAVPAVNRKTDREENVKGFWDSQTPQSHHIVEFNNLETLGVSTRDGSEGMDYFQLPAVLLAAEFHQRYISTILRPMQRWEKKNLERQSVSKYRELYMLGSSLFAPMWLISEVILKKAGLSK